MKNILPEADHLYSVESNLDHSVENQNFDFSKEDLSLIAFLKKFELKPDTRVIDDLINRFKDINSEANKSS